MNKTNISWTDTTWNPIVGCSSMGEGCRNCYARRLHNMRFDAYQRGKRMSERYAYRFDNVRFFEDALREITPRQKPRRIFPCSMSDLFHHNVKNEWLDLIFKRMELCDQHTFLPLTKRYERMREYLSNRYPAAVWQAMPDHIWAGATAWDQESFDAAWEQLRQIPAAHRFISLEPLLSGVDLAHANGCYGDNPLTGEHVSVSCNSLGQVQSLTSKAPKLDWVIVGGETGPGARPMRPDWVRSIRDQCVEAGVPFHFKQWGEWQAIDIPGYIGNQAPNYHYFPDGKQWMFRCGAKRAGHLLDGKEWREFPVGLQGGKVYKKGGE